MNEFPLYHVDAFTSEPFRGNPAVVCLLDSWAADNWLLDVAAEMNLSETAFVVPQADRFGLRWFTPKVEVDLCGHATLAAAHVLWETDRAPAGQPLIFESRSGILGAQWVSGTGPTGATVELDFPLQPPVACSPPVGLLESLDISSPQFVGSNRVDFLVEIESPDRLRGLRPDFARLRTVPARGIIVTCRSDDPRFDFLSRFFAPAAGIDEDPVTGSAHCCLADHWRSRLGKSEFRAYQASARGGIVEIRIVGDRTYLAGNAITVVSGSLRVPHGIRH